MSAHDAAMSTSSNEPSRRIRTGRSTRSRVALRLAVVGAIVVAIGSAVSSVSTAGLSPDLIGVVGLLGFTAVGAVILDRRPGEPIGRICLGIGFMYGVAAILRGVAVSVDGMEGTLPPAFAAVAVISSTIASLALLLSGPLLISRFPHRSADAWQRHAEDVLMATVAFDRRGRALEPGPIDIDTLQRVPNPLAVQGMPLDSETLFTATVLVYGLSYLVTTVGLAQPVSARRIHRPRAGPLVRRGDRGQSRPVHRHVREFRQ